VPITVLKDGIKYGLEEYIRRTVALEVTFARNEEMRKKRERLNRK